MSATTKRPGDSDTSLTAVPAPSSLTASDLPPYYAAVVLARQCMASESHLDGLRAPRSPMFTMHEIALSSAV